MAVNSFTRRTAGNLRFFWPTERTENVLRREVGGGRGAGIERSLPAGRGTDNRLSPDCNPRTELAAKLTATPQMDLVGPPSWRPLLQSFQVWTRYLRASFIPRAANGFFFRPDTFRGTTSPRLAAFGVTPQKWIFRAIASNPMLAFPTGFLPGTCRRRAGVCLRRASPSPPAAPRTIFGRTLYDYPFSAWLAL